MGSSTQTSSSTSGPSNPDLNNLLSQLSKGIGSAYQQGGTTYTDPSAATTNSWQQALGAAGNTDYASGLAGALKSYGRRASGAELGLNDPLYNAQRASTTDRVLSSVNGMFNSSGMLGSDRNYKNAAAGLAEALAPIDTAQRTESYGLQNQALQNLGTAFQGSLMPSSITGAVGSAQDADARAKRLGGLDYLQQFTNLLGGASGASPQTTTTSQPGTPLWQTLLGYGVALL